MANGNAVSNYGGRFEATAGTTQNFGVRASVSGSAATTNYAGYFVSENAGATNNYAGLFSTTADGTELYGVSSVVSGDASGNAYGVSATASSDTGTNYAGTFNAAGAATNNYGGHFSASGGTNNYGGWFSAGAGTVRRAIFTSAGDVLFDDNAGQAGFKFDAEESRVGIGVAPSVKLDVKFDDSSGADSVIFKDSGDTTCFEFNSQGEAYIRTDLAIGLSEPDTNCILHVLGSEAAGDVISLVENTGGAGNAELALKNDDATWRIRNAGQASDTLLFSAGSNNPLQMHTDGTVDLPATGTSDTPKLKLAGVASVGEYLKCTASDGTIEWADAGGGSSLWTENGDDIYYDTGSVGIGTTSPSQVLHVEGRELLVSDCAALGNAQLHIQGNTSSANHLYLGYDTTSNYGFIQSITDGTGYRDFIINALGGSVGIGVDSPDAKLMVSSTGTTENALKVLSSSLTTGSVAQFYSDSATTDTRNLVTITNDNAAATGATALQVKQDSTGLALRVTTPSETNQFTVDDTGVGIGVTPSARLHLKSTGATRIIVDGGSDFDDDDTSLDLYDNGVIGCRVECDGNQTLNLYSGGAANMTTPKVQFHTTGQIAQPVYDNTISDAVTIDFSKSNLQTLTLDDVESSLALDAENHAAGRTVKLLIDMSAAMFSEIDVSGTSWSNFGDDPTALAGSNLVILKLTSWTAADGGVTAEWQEQSSI